MSKQSDLVTVARDAGASGYVNVTGDTMTGNLLLPNLGVDTGDDTKSLRLSANATQATSGVAIQLWGKDVATWGGGIHYLADTRGVDGSHRFWTWDGSAFVNRASIDEAGRLTLPYQPYAQASSSDVSTGKITLNSFNAERGGMSIDNTNQRFNVPVSGAYVIGYHHLGNSGSGNCQVEIRVNGVAVDGSRTQDTNSSNDSFGTQIIKQLSAGDYIEFWTIAGATHGNNNYNSMWAYLLG